MAAFFDWVIGPSTKENRSAAPWRSAIAKHPINLIAR
jgi:hypothetical protein